MKTQQANTLAGTAHRAATSAHPAPVPQRSGFLQRKCACGVHAPAGGECESCKKKRTGLIRHSQLSGVRASSGLPDGSDPLTGALIQSRFGRDFSRILVNGEHQHVPVSDRVHDKAATPDAVRGMNGEREGKRQLDVSVKVQRPSIAGKLAGLGQQPELLVPDEHGIVRTAQSGSASPSPLMPPGPTPAPAPSCSYAISYNNIRNTGCGAGQCGAQIVYDVTGVTATGSGCPASLNGLMVTEAVTTDNGCGPGAVTTGAGCPIEEHPPLLPGHGVVRNCTDTYGMCGPAAAFPGAGCTETYTQKLFVGGVLAETRTIRFAITRSAAGCSGTVARS